MKIRNRVVIASIVGITVTQSLVATFVQPRRVNQFGLQMIQEMRANDDYSIKDGLTAAKHIQEFRRIWADDILFSAAILVVAGVWCFLEIRDVTRSKKPLPSN
jgi:hypothetical protein